MAISPVKPLLLLLLISLFALPALGVTFQNCSDPNRYSVRVKTVKVSPVPVKLKHNANVTIAAFTSKKIPNGATVAVYDLAEKVTRHHSLCKVTAEKELFYFGVFIHTKDVEAPLMCILFKNFVV